jgi:colicin import membrane protein
MTVLLNADADLERIKEEKTAAENATAEKAAAEKATAERATAEKATAERAAAENPVDFDKAREEDQEKVLLAPTEEKAENAEDVPSSEIEDSAAGKIPSSTIEEA